MLMYYTSDGLVRKSNPRLQSHKHLRKQARHLLSQTYSFFNVKNLVAQKNCTLAVTFYHVRKRLFIMENLHTGLINIFSKQFVIIPTLKLYKQELIDCL